MARNSRNPVVSIAGHAADVTPHDTNLLDCDAAIYVGGAGDVTVYTVQGEGPITFAGVPAGSILPVKVSRVMSTDTDATDMVAVW